jgi:pyruvate/2-oxoglutarate dehydrogenase complex dihydrolipoamide acyltransferase (E2) component
MTVIRYIGLKPVKQDNVAATGIVWMGAGDAHEVADPIAASKLLSYPLVWEEVAEAEASKAASDEGNSEDQPPAAAAQKVAKLDALRVRAKELGIDVKGTWGEPRLLKAIADAEAGGAS